MKTTGHEEARAISVWEQGYAQAMGDLHERQENERRMQQDAHELERRALAEQQERERNKMHREHAFEREHLKAQWRAVYPVVTQTGVWG